MNSFASLKYGSIMTSANIADKNLIHKMRFCDMLLYQKPKPCYKEIKLQKFLYTKGNLVLQWSHSSLINLESDYGTTKKLSENNWIPENTLHV